MRSTWTLLAYSAVNGMEFVFMRVVGIGIVLNLGFCLLISQRR